ncbi:FG-GAP repeat domain-containing protein [Roseobacteraceae bacterium NS-SX3]
MRHRGPVARRLPLRLRPRIARRARLALRLWLAALAAPLPAAAETPAVTAARYLETTNRYPHGVLGDDIEYGALELALAGGETVLFRLPETRVFEDIAPRLADLDGDGRPEVLAVESDARLGARLAVYGAGGLIAATPFIGQRFRWLAPIGAADLDGDGYTEIAYIDRPHLAKILRIWRFKDGALTEVASQKGLTNHRIGEAFITSGIRDCGDGPEVVTADGSWRRIVATRLQGNVLVMRDAGTFSAEDGLEGALACR